MEDGHAPEPPAALDQVAARLAGIEQTLREFQKLAWSLLALASRSPMHVDHLEVERLEFKLDTVDVGELSGELNIGLTSRFNLGGSDQRENAPTADEATAPVPEPPPVRPIWPPPATGSGGDDGDSFGPAPGAGDGHP